MPDFKGADMFQNRESMSGWGIQVPATFGTHYPQSPHMLQHGFARHPLLQRGALADAAARLPDSMIECRSADSRNGNGFPMAVRDQQQRLSLIKDPAADRVWTMIRGLEDVPSYEALLANIMTPFQTMILSKTGSVNALKAFIFISPPGALTPAHFDAEWNILLQISGQKTFSILPPVQPWLTLEQQDIYHRCGDNLLPWQDNFSADAQHYALQPGDAVFVPYKAPHWVCVGNEPSVSLSITWRTSWCDDQDAAASMASALQRFGVQIAPPNPWPAQHKSLAFAYHVFRKLRVL
jgi:ribosomal protein L16 Arg81 hydroxylase